MASVAAVLVMKWGYAWSAIYQDAKRVAERRFSWLTLYSRSNSVAGSGNSGSVRIGHRSNSPAAAMAETVSSRVERPGTNHDLSMGEMNVAGSPNVISSNYVPIAELLK